MTGNPDMVYVLKHPDWYTFDYNTCEYVANVDTPDDYKNAVKRFNAYRKEHAKNIVKR